MTTYQPTTSSGDTTSAVESHKQADASVEDAARPIPGEQTVAQNGSKDGGAATIVQPKYDYRQLAHPSWPTSKPGPEITPPPLGQYPLPGRTDQMIYECYDQERGISGGALPTVRVQEAAGTRLKVYRNERKS
jgi:hypothetical protein